MLFIPSLVFFLVAIQVRSKYRIWSYVLLALTIANAISNVLFSWWAADLYTLGYAVLLCLVNSHFQQWWIRCKATTHAGKNQYYMLSTMLISWALGLMTYELLKFNFVTPMIVIILLSLILRFVLRTNKQFLIPGVAAVVADYGWRLINGFFYEPDFISSIPAKALLGLVLLVGIIWWFKRPGIFPILFLTIVETYRFFGVAHNTLLGASTNNLDVTELTIIFSFLSMWMLMLPLFLWFVGLREAKLLRHAFNHNSEAKP